MLYDIIVRDAYILSMKRLYVCKCMTKEQCKKLADKIGRYEFKKHFMIIESRKGE